MSIEAISAITEATQQMDASLTPPEEVSPVDEGQNIAEFENAVNEATPVDSILEGAHDLKTTFENQVSDINISMAEELSPADLMKLQGKMVGYTIGAECVNNGIKSTTNGVQTLARGQ